MSRALVILVLVAFPASLFCQETPEALARKVAEQCFKGFVDKDVDSLMSKMDVPCSFGGGPVINDRDSLRRELEARVSDISGFSENAKLKKTRVVGSLKDVEDAFKVSIDDRHRKLFNELLGSIHRLVIVDAEDGEKQIPQVFLVRIRDGKAKIVGGF